MHYFYCCAWCILHIWICKYLLKGFVRFCQYHKYVRSSCSSWWPALSIHLLTFGFLGYFLPGKAVTQKVCVRARTHVCVCACEETGGTWLQVIMTVTVDLWWGFPESIPTDMDPKIRKEILRCVITTDEDPVTTILSWENKLLFFWVQSQKK